MTNKTIIKCGACGVTLQSQSGACPQCGSNKRHFEVTLEEGITVSDASFRARVSDKGKSPSKFREEYLKRRVTSRKSGKPATETRTIDRGRNRYKHKIETYEGTVEHNEDEKLTDHKKPKKKKKKH